MRRPVLPRRLPSRRIGVARLTERLRRTRTAVVVEETRKRVAENWLLFAGLLLAGLVVLGVSVWPFVRAHLQAVAILQQVSGQPVPRLVADVVGKPTTTEDLNFETESGMVRARLYTPKGIAECSGADCAAWSASPRDR